MSPVRSWVDPEWAILLRQRNAEAAVLLRHGCIRKPTPRARQKSDKVGLVRNQKVGELILQFGNFFRRCIRLRISRRTCVRDIVGFITGYRSYCPRRLVRA